MLWKRSMIKDFEYEFPSEFMTLVLQKESVQVDAGQGARDLQDAFDPQHAVSFEEAITGQEIVYTRNDQGDVLYLFSMENWEGPLVDPEGEVEWDPPSAVDDLLERISDINCEALYPTDMKDAVIGMVERFGMQPLVLLDRDKCIEILMRDDMDAEEAEEFFEYNTIGSWLGDGTPCFATIDRDLI